MRSGSESRALITMTGTDASSRAIRKKSSPGSPGSISSDTVMCAELEFAARGADVLLAENALGGGAPDHYHPRTHMSAVEAGTIAANAGASSARLPVSAGDTS